MPDYSLVKQAASALGYRHNSNQSYLRHFPILALCCILLTYSPGTYAEQPPEYRLKVAFLYNFIAYTEWPDQQNPNLNFCIYGEDPFGEHLQHLRGKKTNEQEILIRHTQRIEDLSMCRIVFISRSAMHDLNAILNQLNGKPILTISDSPNASLQGVVINMSIKEGKVTFEANIASAKRSGLKLSSQLLRFASEVYQ
ncbi:MAG: YfiR family protein [Nitrosomonas oligotropha]|uniref:YfiR family protein n=1 Tax=Nitrosomonas oligotropha TaxID=42354 RepID=A0A5C7VYW2_9PROT|nr:MAG: YfiR family protein [Nitrosomonas oligotropha]